MAEDRRGPDTTWRPTIEGAALGMAVALYCADEVPLVGPSAARPHRCYPRALGTGHVSIPGRLCTRRTIVGSIRFVTRDLSNMDTVRVETDLGPGWATSVEQTALDLCRDRPAWNITDEDRTEMIMRLADRIDWDRVTFFGGTALCRTWLPDLRLSEDIDLLVDSLAADDGLRTHITRRLRREFLNLTWTGLGSKHLVETWTLAADDLKVKVQFARRQERQAIPVAVEPVPLRYSDVAPSVDLRVPTPSGFAAMKLMAWFDRHTPRDLYELAELADAGHIDETEVSLVRSIAS